MFPGSYQATMMEAYQRFVEEQKITYQTQEGYIIPEEVQYLAAFLKRTPSVKKIMEIGFNGGHSSALMLSVCPDITIVSFDIGQWPYVPSAKALIDKHFPGRHTLILGDSRQTVPAYPVSEHGTFDLVFVDGGHSDDVPLKDMLNSLPFLKKDGYMLVDDYSPISTAIVPAYQHVVSGGLVRTVEGPYYGSQLGGGWVLGAKN